MVGHYAGDTIAGAEAHLDRRLEGGLSHRYQLGLYPGELGTSSVLLGGPPRTSRREDSPAGAVVIGLGKMGELNPNTLAEASRHGALSYLMHSAEIHRLLARRVAAASVAGASVGLSVLLIGVTSSSSIGVEDSVGAVLRGVTRANLEVVRLRGGEIRLTDLEIVELFADAAIEACRATTRLVPVLDRELGVTIEAVGRLRTARGRQERLRHARYRDYWRRVEITLVESGEGVSPPLVEPEVIEQLIASVSQTIKDQPQEAKPLLDFLARPWRRGTSEGHLRFLAVSDRARAEVMMQPRQLEVVDRLVATSVRETQFKSDAANTLFELLVPNELKDMLAQQSWLVLIVDSDTASYPWELMVDRQEPLSAKVGMVRQLATASYRQQIRASTTSAAYVVGDPLTAPGHPELPQARAEAALVADLLKRHRYRVTHSEQRPTALEVLNDLFARPYRLLHLAGHGHHQPPRPGRADGRSGLLLQDGVFLTAVEIGQMRQVPDLVFLNCCHIGQVGPEVPFNKLAASVSRELIQMGVRAVVAAGWAVRDDAAKTFARTFYERMLAGDTFGRSLLEARRATYDHFPDCNTWGAYQAYGDPDFTLTPRAESVVTEQPVDFVAPEEVVNELNTIAERAALETGRRGIQRLQRVLKDCPPEWLSRGDVLAALAEAYGELGDFGRAAQHYGQALAAPSGMGGVSLRQVEQAANLEARWGEKTARREPIEHAIGRLGRVLEIGETSERLALLGSAHKRLALVVTDPAEVRAALTASRDCYRKAVQASQRTNAIDPYTVLNWVVGEALLGRRTAAVDVWLARAEARAAERFVISRSYWDAVGRADVAVLRALLDGTLPAPGTVESLVQAYEAVQQSSPPSVRELDSTLSQLKAMADLFRKLGGAEGAAASDALRAIWTRLGGRRARARTGPPRGPAVREGGGVRARRRA